MYYNLLTYVRQINYNTERRIMSLSVTFRMPTPMADRVKEIEKSEDKSRSALLLELIQEALDLRAYQSGETDGKKALEELKEECSTLQIINAVKLLADLYRMNYDQKKSKYGDTAKDVNAALKLIKKEATTFVSGRLKSK